MPTRGIAARRVNDARQEGPVAPDHINANAVARAEDRGDEVGPGVAIEVAHRHVSGNVVAQVLDLDSILERAVGVAVEDERPVRD